MAQLAPQIFISLLTGFAARVLLGGKKKGVVEEDTSTALAKRGSRTPYIMGAEKTGSLVGYVGEYTIKKEKVQGKKGGGGGDADVFYETAWHHLSIGPGIALEEIQENGEVYFKGPITPTDTPSGTEVSLGNGETFIVWWGEPDQPNNSELADQIDVDSGWPWLFSIWWKNKRLGTSHTWPLLEYVIETEMVTSLLQRTPPSGESASVPLPTSRGIIRIAGDTESIWVRENVAAEYPTGVRVDLIDTGFSELDDGSWLVVRAEHRILSIGLTSVPATEIYLTPSFVATAFPPTGTFTGEIRAYSSTFRRLNPAHMLAQLLFEPAPHGMALPQDWFDLESLEDVGEQLLAEGILGRLSLAGNDKVEDAIGKIMLDINCMIFLDTRSGVYTFKLIRELAGAAPYFSAQFFDEKFPETTVPIAGRPVSRLLYSFTDRDFNYETSQVGGIDDDGVFHRQEYADAEVLEMVIPSEISSASVVAELRSQGDLGEGSASTLEMTHGARELVPSTRFEAEGILERMLVSSIQFSQGENAVKIQAISDYFSARLSSFEHTSGNPELPTALPPLNPLAARIVEIPAYLSAGLQLVGVPVIRAHAQISHHELWISGTGVSYTHAGRQTQVQTGGILLEDWDADTDYNLESGPLFSSLGVDLQGRVLDLSGDDTEWRAGRQIGILNDEIIFLDGVSAESGDWRVGRVLRARFDTRKESHASGSILYILEAGELFPINDILLFPGADLYVKPQAVGGGSVPIEDVTELSTTLIGKGVAPLAPVGLRARGDSLPIWCRAFDTGDDIELRWGWQSFATPNTGAGMQPSGNPTGPASIQGSFRVEFRTAASTLKSSYLTSSVSFTLSNAQLVSDFTSEPSSFRVRVLEILGGRESSTVEVLVERI